MYKKLKEKGMEEKFKKFIELRVGEKVEPQQMENYLMMVAEGVSNE